jgi:hypothetical protein
VAYACDPSYSGGRDQEDHSLKPAQGSSLKNPSQKSASGVSQGVGPEFKPQYCQEKNKKEKEEIFHSWKNGRMGIWYHTTLPTRVCFELFQQSALLPF